MLLSLTAKSPGVQPPPKPGLSAELELREIERRRLLAELAAASSRARASSPARAPAAAAVAGCSPCRPCTTRSRRRRPADRLHQRQHQEERRPSTRPRRRPPSRRSNMRRNSDRVLATAHDTPDQLALLARGHADLGCAGRACASSMTRTSRPDGAAGSAWMITGISSFCSIRLTSGCTPLMPISCPP